MVNLKFLIEEFFKQTFSKSRTSVLFGLSRETFSKRLGGIVWRGKIVKFLFRKIRNCTEHWMMYIGKS